jgi:hypothetical protein
LTAQEVLSEVKANIEKVTARTDALEASLAELGRTRYNTSVVCPHMTARQQMQ